MLAQRVSYAVRGSVRVWPALQQRVRQYNFASASYAACFGDLPAAESEKIRQGSVEYMKRFDAQDWHRDPICTVLNGKELRDGREATTVDAFGEPNGKIILSPTEVVDQIISHMRTYRPPKTDYRKELRQIEQKLLSPEYASVLVGNQALDFKKQDGITEMEEAVEANTVERRLNDLLYQDELDGKVTINRSPALVGCVSNFSNFLDLFRKTVRNIELGVPAVVLSRGNTTQHMYRWSRILGRLLEEHGVDAGMLTFASCDVDEQRRIMASNPASPLQFTGSRAIAQAIKEVCPLLMASTGGPNTMVASAWNPAVAEAVRMSAAIENSGQCTALRHLVSPTVTEDNIASAFAKQPMADSPVDPLAAKEFAAIFRNAPFKLFPGYTQHPAGFPVGYKVATTLPGHDIDENWRQVYLDVTRVDPSELTSDAFLGKLGSWLVHHQPISLAVNCATFPESFAVMRKLFERTALVVYTVGSADKPALTAQARPQDAEIFGEFPPRRDLDKYTKYPVIGPSPSAGYNTFYTREYLSEMAHAPPAPGLEKYEKVLKYVVNLSTRGYLRLLSQYLLEAAQGPREGHGKRTALWGLQRPPLDGSKTIIRAKANTSFDDVVVDLLPFLMTNARDQVEVSCDPVATTVAQSLAGLDSGVKVQLEPESEFNARVEREDPWNVLYPAACKYPLVGQHVSLLFPLGHIKCTRGGDREFVEYFKASDKWLRIV